MLTLYTLALASLIILEAHAMENFTLISLFIESLIALMLFLNDAELSDRGPLSPTDISGVGVAVASIKC